MKADVEVTMKADMEVNMQFVQLHIRVDMNSHIATGHMMRCLSIADAARERGMGVHFVCADNQAAELLTKRGYEYSVLNTDWADKDAELDIMVDYIHEAGVKLLLVDSYQVTPKYMATLREHTRTIYIDDLYEYPYSVDMLITYANYYRKWNIEYRDDCEYLLGTAYVPLREEFKNLPKPQINERVSGILVMSGGSDSFHIIKRILERLVAVEVSEEAIGQDYSVTAICGRYSQDFELLSETYRDSENIQILSSVDNLREYICDSDIIISAGGTTLYEICACGIPAITYSFADNQLENVKQFEEDELMIYAGDVRDNDHFEDSIMEAVERLQDIDIRLSISAKMQAAVDGCGAERIADRIVKKY